MCERQRCCHCGLERGGWQQLTFRIPTRAPEPFYCPVALLPLSSASDRDTHWQSKADQSGGQNRWQPTY